MDIALIFKLHNDALVYPLMLTERTRATSENHKLKHNTLITCSELSTFT